MWFAIAAAVGTAVQMYGQQEEADAASDQATLQAELKEKQRKETLERANINQLKLLRDEAILQGNQMTAYARAGVDIGSGSPLLVMTHTIIRSRQEMADMQREASFSGEMLQSEADSAREYGSRVKRAADIRGFGTLALGASSYANSAGWFDKKRTTESDPFGA